MKKVALIFTGGTIAMKVNSKLQGAVPSVSPNELVDLLSEVTDYQNLVAYEFSKLPSPSITPKRMFELKKVIDSYLEDDEFAGAVVIHGTDTLEETAFYLDVVAQSKKPIVLTGSMKNASELGYDGLTNLVSSIKVVLDEKSMNKGVLVVFNYQINAAYEVTKTHTLNLDTFKSFEFGPLGIIDDDEVIYFRELTQRKDYKLQNAYNESTYLIKAYTGLTGEIIDFYVNQGAKGIVIEALGRGNVPPMMMDAIKNAIKKAVKIVIVSRCYGGRVLDTYGYLGGGKDLLNSGCILGGNLSGPKARLLLMIGLSNNLDDDAIRDIFK
ncbi:MAG: asparaginase [Candidatus Izemoplasmataceae bacterium]